MRAMMLVAGFLALLTVWAAGLHADEQKVPLDKVPKLVLDAVKKRFPKAKWIEAAKETVRDKTEYEISIKDGATKIDVMVTLEGKITRIEKVISAKDLPKAVTEALHAKYPKAKFRTIEEVIKVTGGREALDYYEVLLITVDKKMLEVEITPGGTIKKTEAKNPED